MQEKTLSNFHSALMKVTAIFSILASSLVMMTSTTYAYASTTGPVDNNYLFRDYTYTYYNDEFTNQHSFAMFSSFDFNPRTLLKLDPSTTGYSLAFRVKKGLSITGKESAVGISGFYAMNTDYSGTKYPLTFSNHYLVSGTDTDFYVVRLRETNGANTVYLSNLGIDIDG